MLSSLVSLLSPMWFDRASDRLRSLEVQGMYPVHGGDASSPYKWASRILSRDQLVIEGTTSRVSSSGICSVSRPVETSHWIHWSRLRSRGGWSRSLVG